jgi:hypothetical protein
MASDGTELIYALDETVALLRSYGEKHWAEWLAGDRASIANGNAGGVTHLLSAFGGMGSFNDLFLSPANGHYLSEADVSATNARLNELRARLYDLAQAQR